MKISRLSFLCTPLLLAGTFFTPPATADSETSSHPTASTCTPQGQEARVLFYQDSHEFAPKVRADGERGGIARLATVLKKESNGDSSTDIVFGGDLAGGTLFGGFYKGLPFIEAMNRMGVDLAAFGQHDFDFGAAHTRQLVSSSNFPWISSNLTTTDGSPFVPATTALRTVGGVKIGYLALTTGMSTTSASKEVREQDIVESAVKASQDLHAQGAEIIIALGQISASDAQKVMQAAPHIKVMLREESSAAATGSVVEIPQEGASPRLILESYGDYGNVYTLSITPTNCGQSISYKSTLVNGDIAEDPQILDLQNSYVNKMEEALSSKVTTSSHLIDTAEGGALVARAYRERMGTQLGWQNGGGVRAKIEAGDVTLRSLHSVLPFGNKVIAIEVTGAQLLQGLEQGANSSPSGSGGYPRTSGFDYQYVPSAPEGQRIVNAKLDDGTPINPSGVYTLALTNYVYNGGNKVTAFSGAKVISTEILTDVDALISLARAHSVLPLSPITGQQLSSLPTPKPSDSLLPEAGSSHPIPSQTSPSSSTPSSASALVKAKVRKAPLARTGAEIYLLGCGTLILLGVGAFLRRRSSM